MIFLVGILAVIILLQWRHIISLRRQIRAHEETWLEIEEITDHNKDGDIVVHCRHTEDK